MHVAISIKIVLEITLFDFMFTTWGSNNCVFLDKSRNNMSCYKLIFSLYQCLIKIIWLKFTKQLQILQNY